MSSSYPPPDSEPGDEGSARPGSGDRPEGEWPYRPPDDRPQYGQPQYGQPGYGSPPQYGPQYGQPGYGAAPQYGVPTPPPPNYLVWAILTTLLCCLPLGIVSIVFSTQVNTKWAAGDQHGAAKASRGARNFAIASAVAGGVLALGFGVLVLLGAVGASTTPSY